MPISETLVLAEFTVAPFVDFLTPTLQRGHLRSVITENYHASEEVCVARLLKDATLPENIIVKAETTGRALITALRERARAAACKSLSRSFAVFAGRRSADVSC